MTEHERDALLKELARRYVRGWGGQLQAEADALGEADTPGLDRKVRAALGQRRRRRTWVAAAALAACLALVVAVGPLRPRQSGGGAASDTTGATASQVTMEVIPLGFDLPGQFQVADVQVDQRQTVYTLSDRLLDDVVLTLELDAPALDTAGMTAISLDGRTVYGRATADYCLLAFDREGVRHVMTCQYDINTLLGLAEEIIL